MRILYCAVLEITNVCPQHTDITVCYADLVSFSYCSTVLLNVSLLVYLSVNVSGLPVTTSHTIAHADNHATM